MEINLLSIVKTDNNSVQVETSFEADTYKSLFGEYKVVEKPSFILKINHSTNHELSVQGETVLTFEIPCDRCLVPVEVEVPILIDREVKLNELSKNDDISEELNYIDGYNLDVDKLLYNEILIGWPMKTLCCDTCKGVCNACGQNLNQDECTCEDMNLDPRMSVIRDVFKNFKEV